MAKTREQKQAELDTIKAKKKAPTEYVKSQTGYMQDVFGTRQNIPASARAKKSEVNTSSPSSFVQQEAERMRTMSNKIDPIRAKGQALYDTLTPEQKQQRTEKIQGFQDMTAQQRAGTFGEEGPGRRGTANTGEEGIIGYGQQAPTVTPPSLTTPTSTPTGEMPATPTVTPPSPTGGDSGTVSTPDMSGKPTTSGMPTSENLPEVFQNQMNANVGLFNAGMDLAQGEFGSAEDARKKLLIRQLGQTNVVEAMRSEGVDINQFTIQQLEDLAVSEGVDLSSSVKERLKQGGLAQIENLKLERGDRLAEIEYTRKQTERQFDRGLNDREEFNMQQDVRMRRLLNTFGGGKVQDLAGNIEVMRGLEKGQRALEDMRSEYKDFNTEMGRKADLVIKQYTANVNGIEAEMSNILESKLSEVMGTVDNLIAQGVTNKSSLNKALYSAKKDYINLYADITTKASEYIQKENQNLFERQMALKKEQREMDKYMTDITGNVFMGGQPIIDDQGNAVPTFENIKWKSGEDRAMSGLTGILYENGMPKLDQFGNTIPTLETQKFQSQEARMQQQLQLDQMKFNENVRQFGMEYALQEQKYIDQQRQNDFNNQLKMVEKGIQYASGVDMSTATSSFNPSKSKYSIVPSANGIEVNAPTVQSGGKTVLAKGRRQCGMYVNDVIGIPSYFGDSFESKARRVTTNVPSPGSAFVLNVPGLKYGHVGLVEKVFPDGSIQISESNGRGGEEFSRSIVSINDLQKRGLVGFTGGLMSKSGLEMRGAAQGQGITPRTTEGKEFNATQAQAFDYASRMTQAENIFQNVAGEIEGAAKAARPGLRWQPWELFGAATLVPGYGELVTGRALPSGLKGAGLQQQEQAERSFINSVLRRESGAVISDQEFENARKQYFPQPGDTQEVLDQKRRNRDQAIKGMYTQAGVNPSQYLNQ